MTPLLPPHLLTSLLEGPDSMAQMMHTFLQLETARAPSRMPGKVRRMSFREGEMPWLTLTKLEEGNDDMKAFLDTFKVVARANHWPEEHKVCTSFGLLSDAGMLTVANLPAKYQAKYDQVG